MMLVFINIFRDITKCQFAVGTVEYARNNFPLNRFNPGLLCFCVFHFFCGCYVFYMLACYKL